MPWTWMADSTMLASILKMERSSLIQYPTPRPSQSYVHPINLGLIPFWHTSNGRVRISHLGCMLGRRELYEIHQELHWNWEGPRESTCISSISPMSAVSGWKLFADTRCRHRPPHPPGVRNRNRQSFKLEVMGSGRRRPPQRHPDALSTTWRCYIIDLITCPIDHGDVNCYDVWFS
jgi:hypothetical protein